jgi:tyrosyl-tRNA synthetase
LNISISPTLRDLVEKDEKCSVYAGYDPTADSLHIGHLISIITLRHLQQAGLNPIAIVGGATGMVGDPSGRSEERPLLGEAQIEHNLSCLRNTLSSILGENVKVLNNYDWYRDMSAISFLRNVGKHFRMGSMLAKDSVKSRLDGDGMSFTEFSYQLLQGYDFNHLFQHHNCKIQIGGSDQWGNITAGIDLIHKLHGQEAFGFTVPLLTTAGGVKISKSMGNAVWLSPHRDSPYQLYQWAMRLDDADIEPMLRLLTFLPMKQVSDLAIEHSKKPELREGHKILAAEVTKLVHGEKGLNSARGTTEILYGGKFNPSITRASDLEAALKDSGCIAYLNSNQVIGSTLLSVADLAGIAPSKGAIRRMAENGGLYLNNNSSKLERIIEPSDLIEGQALLLRTGKKNYKLVFINKKK